MLEDRKMLIAMEMSNTRVKTAKEYHCESCGVEITKPQILCIVCDREGRRWCEECCTAEIGNEIDLEKKWKESQPRYTDSDYLRIFPEVGGLVAPKLEELRGRRLDITGVIKRQLTLIQGEADEFAVWLGREWLKINAVGDLSEVDSQIQRFERLKAISEGKKPKDLSEAIQRALQVSILDVAPLAFKKAGKDFIALCPFHSEKKPSFHVFRKNGQERFYCFGCLVGGDVIDFIQRYRSCSFRDALKELTGEKL